MPLDPDDVQAIGQLLDERLTAYDQRQRARRRWWLWFWIVLFVVSTVASGVAMKRVVDAFMSQVSAKMDQIDAQERDFAQGKALYQKQVAQDQQLQKDRADAEKAAHYESAQTTGEYNASLIRQSMALFAQSAKAQDKAKSAAAGDDPDADMKAMEEQMGTLTQGTSVLMQILLRNTDPAHDTAQERLAAGADGQQPTVTEQKFEELQRQLATMMAETDQAAPVPDPASPAPHSPAPAATP